MDNFMQYVSELEQVVSTAKKSVFSGSDVIVNRAQVLDIIDRMRAAYPDVMRQAQFIVDDCENQKQRGAGIRQQRHKRSRKPPR